TGWHLQPTLAESGPEGLAALKRAAREGRPFPLILLDAMMPEMDGFAVVQRIKADPELTGATILMLSSAAQLADAARCRELGISCFLVKPVRQSELLTTIQRALGTAGVPHWEAGKGQQTVQSPSVRGFTGTLRVLLAEDNPVNQKLAVRMLE